MTLGRAAQWRVLIDATGASGASNMAKDEALLEDAGRSGHAYLRLYTWDPPCLSFGAHEPALRRYDRAAIERRRWSVVRRPTGGRAVWHQHELTYAVALPLAGLGDVNRSSCEIHRRIAAGLRSLGVPIDVAPPPARTSRRGLPGPGDSPCFASASPGELLLDERKIAGSAQLRRGGALLQHGSVLLDGSQEIVDAVSRRPTPPFRHTTLREALGRPTSFAEVAAALLDAWCAPHEHLVRLDAGIAPSAHATDFSNPAWTWRR